MTPEPEDLRPDDYHPPVVCTDPNCDHDPHDHVSGELVDELRVLGDSYGPLGVALAAAQLTDARTVMNRLEGRDDDDGDEAVDDNPYPEQRPSVGRVVHYVSYGTPRGEYKSECRAAIVTEVGCQAHEPEDFRFVGLAVLNPTGIFLNRCLLYDSDRTPGSWHWPERVPEEAGDA